MNNKLASLTFIFIASIIFGSNLGPSTGITSAQYGEVYFNDGEEKKETTEDLNYKEILFVGDVFLGRRVEYYMDTISPNYPFANLPPISSSTAFVANFESAVNPQHVRTPDLTYAFSTKPEYFSQLADYGVTHLSLANNHSMDFGQEGLALAKESAQKNKLIAFGDQSDLPENSVTTITVDNKPVTIVALNFIFNNYNQEDLLSFLQELADRSDFLVVFVHWGSEYQLNHSLEQRAVADSLVNSGVDLIIGHHPHVVQDIEIINGVPVFYSLGNFIFDQYFSTYVQEGLQLKLTNNESSWQIELIPVSSLQQRSAPALMNDKDKSDFLDALANRSAVELQENIRNGLLYVQ